MLRKALAVLALVVLALPLVAGADTVNLRDGRSVTGKILGIKDDKLYLRTDAGVVQYTREQVKNFQVVQRGPDGRPVVTTGRFSIRLPFKAESKHYIVQTDTAAHVAKNAARAMEQLHEAYTRIFGADDKAPKRKADVLIFDSQKAFTEYANSINVQPRKDTLGFFITGRGGRSQIVTFKRRTSEFHTLSTLYHEATHQFFRMWLGPGNNPPLWVNEGLAVYFENSRWRAGKLRTGIVPKARLALLQRRLRTGRHVRLADLIKRGRDRYDGLCYAEGWSLVHFFVRANGGRHARRFSRYVRMLKERADPDEAFRASFGRDINKVERAWKRYVLGLKAPRR